MHSWLQVYNIHQQFRVLLAEQANRSPGDKQGHPLTERQYALSFLLYECMQDTNKASFEAYCRDLLRDDIVPYAINTWEAPVDDSKGEDDEDQQHTNKS